MEILNKQLGQAMKVSLPGPCAPKRERKNPARALTSDPRVITPAQQLTTIPVPVHT